MIAEEVSQTTSWLDGVRVLVVDDSAVIRSLLAAVLEECGAAVTRERPDVLVSDLEMPDKGGYWPIGRVRALSPERGGTTPAAALTGLGPEHRASVLRAGFQDHVEKPVDLQSLVGVVTRLTGKASRRLEAERPVAARAPTA